MAEITSRFLLGEQCYFTKVTQEVIDNCRPFSCGDSDLDDFFAHDTVAYDADLMGKTYCWVLREDVTRIIGMVTVANAAIQTTHLQNHPRRKLNQHIANNKRGRTYPAVLIGRLGVNSDFQTPEFQIGAQIMNFIKEWFKSADNKTGCRFVIVDALNSPRVMGYYERNGFRPLFPRIEDEKEFYEIPADEDLRSRILYFDLL